MLMVLVGKILLGLGFLCLFVSVNGMMVDVAIDLWDRGGWNRAAASLPIGIVLLICGAAILFVAEWRPRR